MEGKEVNPDDRRVAPLYTVSEAAHYLGLPASTLASWIATPGEGIAPLSFVSQDLRMLSFFDLVEAHILRAVRERRVTKSRLLRGLAYLRERFPNDPRPLLTFDFYAHGKDLLVDGILSDDPEDGIEKLVNASRDGQIELREVIKEHLELIARDEMGLPKTLFPKNGRKVVSITQGILSGRPVIDGTRISTDIIAQRYRAGDPIEEIARDYKLELETIRAVVGYEAA